MDRRVLIVATVPSMIGQFNMGNIKILLGMGYEVNVAADFNDTSAWPAEKIQKFRNDMKELNVECVQIDFSRNVLKLNKHFGSYKEILRLVKNRNYSFIHTHTPIASAIVRIAAHKERIKVIYTAHGFHFYKGAPLNNWLIFYCIEKFLSKWTDILITITKEDYYRAKKRFHSKVTSYIPGVGVDTEKYKYNDNARNKIRAEFGIDSKSILLLSVGELNENKNHSTVINALQGMNVTYIIVGKGKLEKKLKELAEDKKVDLRLPGYRYDVADFYSAADIYVLPSIREGLNVSLLEAMSSGLPVVCGKIRGNTDLIIEGMGGEFFDPKSSKAIRSILERLVFDKSKLKRYGCYNRKRINKYDTKSIREKLSETYIKINNL